MAMPDGYTERTAEIINKTKISVDNLKLITFISGLGLLGLAFTKVIGLW